MNHRMVGSVALTLRDESVRHTQVMRYEQLADVMQSALNRKNKGYIKQALLGGTSKVICVVLPVSSNTLEEALHVLETKDYTLCAFPGATLEETASIVAWAKQLDEKIHRGMVCVADAIAPNHPRIINFCTSDILLKGRQKPMRATEYTARIAGIFAGIPLWQSATHQILEEVQSVPYLHAEEISAYADAGKIILFAHGDTIKLSRDVTSITNIGEDTNKSSVWRNIHAVRIVDKVHKDVESIIDQYAFKVPDDTQNRQQLIREINGYLKALEAKGILRAGYSYVDFDYEKLREMHKQGQIIPQDQLDAMDDDTLAMADVSPHVLLTGVFQVPDRMERVDVSLTIL